MAFNVYEFVLGIFLVLFTFRALGDPAAFSFVGTIVAFIAVIWVLWGAVEFIVGHGTDRLLAGTAVSVLMILLFNGGTALGSAFGAISSIISGIVGVLI